MLDNQKINVRSKLSFLWTSVMFCFLYGDYFELYVPKKIQGLMSGVNMLNSPTKLFIASVVLSIPAIMIAITALINSNVVKWLNIFFGFMFALMMILILINSISIWYAFYVFFAILEVIIALTIVWQAWSWPKRDQSFLK